MRFHTIMLLTVLCLFPAIAFAQMHEILLPRWGIKTNLLWDATTTINFGVEFRTDSRTSLDIPFNYNAWTFSKNRKWKHILIQPEFRWWTKEVFRGHFFGLHAHYANYNVGALPEPFSDYMKTHRFEGWLAGGGVSYGYRWNFNRRLALEAAIGVGYAYMSYDKFDCGRCGEQLNSAVRQYFGPTRAGVTLIYGIGGKQVSKQQSVPVYVVSVSPVIISEPEPESAISVTPYEPELHASFITPEVETVKARNVSGRAYLDFAVNRSEIVPGFRNNAAELQKIHASIESVKNNPDATITGISIIGYASPEGTWESNRILSERRAQALKKHIVSIHGLREDMFSVWGAGEDWLTLDTLVERSDMVEKYRILEIIRDTDIFAGRESRLMMLSGGNPYRQMKAMMFPQLRRSDYNICYTIAPFTVEQGKEVFRSHPGNLSLNEIFMIANTYEPGSDLFNEVFETAARIFPANDVACMNAAASALGRKDVASAARYLNKVKEHTPDYWNNMGILMWLQGNWVEATGYFAKGGIRGMSNASELEKSQNMQSGR